MLPIALKSANSVSNSSPDCLNNCRNYSKQTTLTLTSKTYQSCTINRFEEEKPWISTTTLVRPNSKCSKKLHNCSKTGNFRPKTVNQRENYNCITNTGKVNKN